MRAGVPPHSARTMEADSDVVHVLRVGWLLCIIVYFVKRVARDGVHLVDAGVEALVAGFVLRLIVYGITHMYLTW